MLEFGKEFEFSTKDGRRYCVYYNYSGDFAFIYEECEEHILKSYNEWSDGQIIEDLIVIYLEDFVEINFITDDMARSILKELSERDKCELEIDYIKRLINRITEILRHRFIYNLDDSEEIEGF